MAARKLSFALRLAFTLLPEHAHFVCMHSKQSRHIPGKNPNFTKPRNTRSVAEKPYDTKFYQVLGKPSIAIKESVSLPCRRRMKQKDPSHHEHASLQGFCSRNNGSMTPSILSTVLSAPTRAGMAAGKTCAASLLAYGRTGLTTCVGAVVPAGQLPAAWFSAAGGHLLWSGIARELYLGMLLRKARTVKVFLLQALRFLYARLEARPGAKVTTSKLLSAWLVAGSRTRLAAFIGAVVFARQLPAASFSAVLGHLFFSGIASEMYLGVLLRKAWTVKVFLLQAL